MTFDTDERGLSWYFSIKEVSQDSWLIFVVHLLFVVLTSFGLLNLIVGVMVDQSFTIVAREKSRMREEAVQKVSESLLHAKSAFTSGLLNKATKLRDLSAEDLAKSIQVTLSSLEHAISEDPSLVAALESGGINSQRISKIFHELEEYPGAPLRLSHFMEGCLRVNQTIQHVDVMACKITNRRLCKDLKVLHEATRRFCDVCTRFSGKEYRLAKEDHPRELQKAYRELTKENAELHQIISQLKRMSPEEVKKCKLSGVLPGSDLVL